MPRSLRPTLTGSALSTRELGFAAIKGVRVTVYLTSGLSLEGYVCGMDDFHWRIILAADTEPLGQKGQVVLVHKASATCIVISDEQTLGDEDHPRFESLVGPFRRSMEKAIFSGGSQARERGPEHGTVELRPSAGSVQRPAV